jgi:predicted dienelactone hydrolase
MKRLLRILVKLLKLGVLAFLVVVVASAALTGYLAIARNAALALPVPTGSYTVGRSEYNWVDSDRTDPLADEGNAPRELVVWVWFPAAQAGTTPAPYLPPAWVQVRNTDQGALGKLIENDFNRFQTHSYAGVPLAAAPAVFPVLIMEPGMGPIATDYTVLAENLASHGYIVVGINPTDSANTTVFLNGMVVLRTAKGTIPDNATPAEGDADANRIEAVWQQDEVFVLDQLAALNAAQSGFFSHRLDLQHVGAWGHSFGGVTALGLCQADPRCQAGVDMDGTPTSNEMTVAVPKPFMFMTEDYSKGCDQGCAAMRQVFLNTKAGEAYSLSIAGTRHFNFSDLPYRQVPLIEPLFVMAGYEGAIQPRRGLQIVNAYLVAFFDQYLKGSTQDLLKGPALSFPEVIFDKH